MDKKLFLLRVNVAADVVWTKTASPCDDIWDRHVSHDVYLCARVRVWVCD